MSKLVRKTPCPTCPYRRDVPSGIWDRSEYEKLPRYDGDVPDQVQAGAMNAFNCHKADGQLCAGWAGHRDPADLLAVRLGLAQGSIDPSVLDYDTAVPLFASGAEAAAHGLADIDAPGDRARDAARKLLRSNPDLYKGDDR